MSTFDWSTLREGKESGARYERQLAKLRDQQKETDKIVAAVEHALSNLALRQRSFVIFGEPQSGKTEMMISLTARLLDEGFKIIIILLNDSVQLLNQNLERFQRSGLSPSPKRFSEILPPEMVLGDHPWVIFCKKNSKDLQKLLDKLRGKHNRIVIDDEADYATPNSKVNKDEKSRIYELTEHLLGIDGTYIGVTATPARLDLNRTHMNENEHWVDFPPHSFYVGQDVFFPNQTEDIEFTIKFLPEAGDFPKYLREALFSFMVNAAHMNVLVNEREENYSILVHTSGSKDDHSIDYANVVKVFEVLRDESNSKHEAYFRAIWDIANSRYPGHADALTRYVINNCERNNVVVMNSDKEKNAADNRTATSPSATFTVVIGGNIVSRGVTFDNLLSMYFTRDVKHRLQQDTYIQRARMFGSRRVYLDHFELTIPKHLYLDWHRCFIFHRLSLEARKQNFKSPVWLDGERIAAVSPSSIDKTNVVVDKGEMSFDLFPFKKAAVESIIGGAASEISKVRSLAQSLGNASLPPYLVSYIEGFCPDGNNSIAVHSPISIAGYTDKEDVMDKATITVGSPGTELEFAL